MIHKYSWGASWILFGVAFIWQFPYLNDLLGASFIVAGVSYILDK